MGFIRERKLKNGSTRFQAEIRLKGVLNMAIKLLRCHNETIEALSRYQRGGEQRVVVQHIADKIAVVNNFGGTEGEGAHKNKGASPCP